MMFVAHLADGTLKSEKDFFWHDMPRGVAIKELQAVGDDVCDSLSGFDAYGFQKYQVTALQGPDSGKAVAWGCQLIGIDEKSGKVVTVDVNPVSGVRATSYTDLKDLSYNRELLRSGHGR
jgi:hypothetical protein